MDEIVNEVKQSAEWEAVKMNILEIGIKKGRQEGLQAVSYTHLGGNRGAV